MASVMSYPAQTTMIKYGLFCEGTEFSNAPAITFYTRFAAEKKCRELNGKGARAQWFIRKVE